MNQKNQENPLVTVYIPTYNRVEMLKRAVESVLNQTYANLEVIVVDDFSPDNTLEYLAEISQQDSRVRYFQNETNSGACVSRNKAINEAKGEFITGLDDDDYFLPERIESFVRSWSSIKSKYPDMICLFSNVIVKRKDGKIKKYTKPKIVKQKDLLVANFIGNQVFTKTESLKAVMFDEALPMWQDLDCWYRLLADNLAINSLSFNYVMDTSHIHERISLKNIDFLHNNIKYFSIKYNLDKRDFCLLQNHFYSYFPKELSFITYINMLLCQKSIYAFISMSKKLLISWGFK
jgi:glycosyltransferase involved in cell wall biosynthesis